MSICFIAVIVIVFSQKADLELLDTASGVLDLGPEAEVQI